MYSPQSVERSLTTARPFVRSIVHRYVRLPPPKHGLPPPKQGHRRLPVQHSSTAQRSRRDGGMIGTCKRLLGLTTKYIEMVSFCFGKTPDPRRRSSALGSSPCCIADRVVPAKKKTCCKRKANSKNLYDFWTLATYVERSVIWMDRRCNRAACARAPKILLQPPDLPNSCEPLGRGCGSTP